MKKVIFLFLCMIVCVGTIVLLTATGEKEYLYIGNSDIYFGMSRASLIEIMGEPEEIINGVSDTPMDEYLYSEEFDGHTAKCSYLLLDSCLTEMSITVEDISYDAAWSTVEGILESQEEYYSHKSGYYLENNTDHNAEFSVSTGVDSGGTGISFEYTYSSGRLTIHAVKQE